jgi:uncharacterized membrane protein YqjE
MESSKRIANTLLAVVQTRLDLLSNEIEEERLRIGKMFLYGSVALLFFGLSIMLLTVFIVVLFWDTHRLFVLGSMAVLFFSAGLWIWETLRRMVQGKSKLFSVSIAELADDRNRLAPSP